MKKLYKKLFLLAIMLISIGTFPTKLSAQHFNFQGGSFTGSQWSVFIGGATLNGENLVPGDEIAVFDGEIMVGAYVLTQVCTQENQLENKLTAFTVLLDRALGYTTGNPVSFKCWKASTGVEIELWAANWLDPYGDAWTQEFFPSGVNSYSMPLIEFTFSYNGSIGGIVKDANDAQPIEGAEVKIIENGQTAVTLPDGIFQFTAIPIGTYSLVANKAGYMADTMTGIGVSFNQNTTVDFTLTKILATLEGTITNQNSEPVEGATISISGQAYSTQSLSDGSYSMGQIPEGIYTIQCTAEGYFPENSDGISLTNNGTTNLSFTLTGSTHHTIALRQGYSLVSSYIMPDAPGMLEVMGESLNNLEFARNDQGNMLVKIGPNWINGIGNWSPAEGYLFKMYNADSITLTGSYANNPPLILNQGYSIIPFTLHKPKNAMEVFEGSLDKLALVRNSNGQQMLKMGNNWVNLIGDMKPGEGYLVKMNQADTLFQRPFECGDLLFDNRDGNTYKTVQIGEQCWMAENLNVGERIDAIQGMSENGVTEKYCYNNEESYCDDLGGLYQWNEMMQYLAVEETTGICPEGWRLSSDSDWCILEQYVDSTITCNTINEFRGIDGGTKLKIGGTSGFNAIFAGRYYGNFEEINDWGNYWTSSQYDNDTYLRRKFGINYDEVFRDFGSQEMALSVRCVKRTSTINRPPDPPSNPQPSNSSVNTSTDTTLSWSCSDPENDPLTYDVYFGTETKPPQVETGIADTFYTPGTLDFATTYYWKIVAHDDHGNSTEGEVWSFTTMDEPWQCGDSLVDDRDGQKYGTVQIGVQCWMAENLNVGERIDDGIDMEDNDLIEKRCYNDDDTNCELYGGLYQWNEMMQYILEEGTQGICPNGWHIPPDNEWKILEGNVDSQYSVGDPIWDNGEIRGFDAGLNLRSTYGWQNNNNGNDLFGYTCLPGGLNFIGGGYYEVEINAYIWTSTTFNSFHAWQRGFHVESDGILRDYHNMNMSFSARCIHDDFFPINQPPNPPSTPQPSFGSTNISTDATFSWSCTDPENDPLTYDVYFGIDTMPLQVATGIADTFYIPGTLEYAATYYWKIVAHDDHGNSAEGEVWSFTTKDTWECGDNLVDDRDGQFYTTVLIGEQCWMAENLKYLPEVSPSAYSSETEPYYYVYDYQGTDVNEAKATNNYQNYGVLYNWPAATTSCPNSWHLPSDVEWTILSDYLGDENIAGGKMKSIRTIPDPHPRWDSPNSGASNSSGFTGLPGGNTYPNGSFESLGGIVYFWSTTETTLTNNYWLRALGSGDGMLHRYGYTTQLGLSVRCLRD